MLKRNWSSSKQPQAPLKEKKRKPEGEGFEKRKSDKPNLSKA